MGQAFNQMMNVLEQREASGRAMPPSTWRR
jgi:hypothetical protein